MAGIGVPKTRLALLALSCDVKGDKALLTFVSVPLWVDGKFSLGALRE